MVATGLVLLAVLAAVLAQVDPGRQRALLEAVHLLAAALLTAAGVLALVRWRACADRAAASVGAGLLALGGLADVLHQLSPIVGVDPAAGHAVVAGTVTAGALALLLLARRTDGTGARWLDGVLGLQLLSTGLVESAGSVHVAVAGTGPALGLAAAALALSGCARELRRTLGAQAADLAALTLSAHEQQLRELQAEAERAEQLHEVRSVLAGLHGAHSTLSNQDELDLIARRRLEDAVTDELRRLAHLVDPAEGSAQTATMDLADALDAVVVAAQVKGGDITVDLDAATAIGHQPDLATITDVLLGNARCHAPGSPVVVRAEQHGGTTTLFVEDRGPGVPYGQRARVFERGERAGASAPGSGLGLYTAARLAREMGGHLEARDRDGGGASFALTLPSQPLRDEREQPEPAGPRG